MGGGRWEVHCRGCVGACGTSRGVQCATDCTTALRPPSTRTPPHPPPTPGAFQALEQRNRGITAAWRWVQANQDRFRGRVYGPIAVEVECPDPQHLQYLEQHVSGEPAAAV